ncbi:uncharacterized protein LOC125946334 [Dermacentor silvarum]|uniref:uncharacterized protein LOC125946334 n=1 Tax=Dermacentor silvarum TaxID=543639 RepID=UPI002100E0BC|nr:uncharacterized protein LOC125946334 [Dermacentor silvarum]
MTCLRHSLLVLVLCYYVSQTAVGARRLNRFVRHFEPLSYEPRPVHRGHVRVRRSLGGSHPQQQQQQQSMSTSVFRVSTGKAHYARSPHCSQAHITLFAQWRSTNSGNISRLADLSVP